MWHKNKSIALYLLHSERPPLTALTPRCTDAWLQVIKKKDLSLTKSPPNAKLFNCLSARITHGKKLHKKSSEAKQISTCSRVLAEWRAVEWSEGAQRLFLCGEALIVQLCLRVLGVWMSLKHPPPSPPHPPLLSLSSFTESTPLQLICSTRQRIKHLCPERVKTGECGERGSEGMEKHKEHVLSNKRDRCRLGWWFMLDSGMDHNSEKLWLDGQ